ncbi:MAG: hypothetical protein Fur0018_15140 [Anaerolineales bacterium]
MTSNRLASPTPRARQGAGCFWNILTGLILLATLGAAGIFGWIYLRPTSPLNPFPPATLPALAVLPTAAPTSTPLPPTETPTPLPTATPTNTPLPPTATFTASPEASPTLLTSQASPTLRPTATPGGYAFITKDTPLAIQNIFHGDAGCNWLGVGGNIEDLRGGGKLYVTVHLHGSVNGQPVDIYTVSGAARQYGEGGYEFHLDDSPANSHNSLYIQLLDQANLPLSDRIFFDTYDSCEKNSIIINFQQVR